jgi:predicted 3-demethylubiquinone-9 3-methyltransferase (glyoxalase superfamily)
MIVASPGDSSPWASRAFLRDVQYQDGTNLAARQSLYAYQQPFVDLPAWVLDVASPSSAVAIADIGCGNGAYLAGLDRRGHRGRSGRTPAAWCARSDDLSGRRSSYVVTNAEGGKRMTSKPFTTCLWFDTQAEEAANFYASIFKDSKLGRIFRYNAAGPGAEGTVGTIEFELNGQKFVGLNGGPQYQFTPAVSLTVECANQAEIDYYWERLLDGGGQEVACGWLTDKYGLSWQVVASEFLDMITGPDAEAATRATAAMYQMKKFDIAALRKAYAGDQ